MPELSISSDNLRFLIVKAREFDVKEANSDPDSGSNGADDGMTDVLEDNGDDPVEREISGFVNALSSDEQADLIALLRLGRGDGTLEDWDEIRAEVVREPVQNVAKYLLGQPLLGDLIEEGLDELGIAMDAERTTPVS